jgi:hypothetical protein
MSKHGTMATDRPERYAKQLASHWSQKATVTEDAGTTTLVMGNGNTVALRPAAGALEIETAVTPEGDLDRWSEVVADHLQRFGKRDELRVVWA